MPMIIVIAAIGGALLLGDVFFISAIAIAAAAVCWAVYLGIKHKPTEEACSFNLEQDRRYYERYNSAGELVGTSVSYSVK